LPPRGPTVPIQRWPTRAIPPGRSQCWQPPCVSSQPCPCSSRATSRTCCSGSRLPLSSSVCRPPCLSGGCAPTRRSGTARRPGKSTCASSRATSSSQRLPARLVAYAGAHTVALATDGDGKCHDLDSVGALSCRVCDGQAWRGIPARPAIHSGSEAATGCHRSVASSWRVCGYWFSCRGGSGPPCR